ncbi:hypothetical protein [Albimonas donghaensis]|uniref:hypothetical protein n=1 Tax=Albimonas donghaensis TaxID=356660 RepID=UPI000A8EC9B2|nr:hypothetical protein [Albimonas donghaensis]
MQISSIAVLEDFAGRDDEGSERFQQALAYGRRRRMLETFCAERFPRCSIVRLPALFGPGLRKNFIFDPMNPMPSMLPEAKLADLCDGLGPGRPARTRPRRGPGRLLRARRGHRHAEAEPGGL